MSNVNRQFRRRMGLHRSGNVIQIPTARTGQAMAELVHEVLHAGIVALLQRNPSVTGQDVLEASTRLAAAMAVKMEVPRRDLLQLAEEHYFREDDAAEAFRASRSIKGIEEAPLKPREEF